MKSFTTKIMALGLTAIMLTGAVTACKTTKTAGAPEANAQAKQEQSAGENGGMQVVGGWTIPESHEVTEELKKYYKAACSKYDGTGSYHEPVALLATQVVNGTNYCFYCVSTMKSSSGPLSPVIAYVNVKPSGEADFIKTDRDILPGSGEQLPGGWENAADYKITDEIKSILEKASATLTGATYEPVAYIGSQVVSGKNHYILCKMTPSVKELNGAVSYVFVTVYENLEGKCEITDTKDYKLGI